VNSVMAIEALIHVPLYAGSTSIVCFTRYGLSVFLVSADCAVC
jgi:hypothetical protein